MIQTIKDFFLEKNFSLIQSFVTKTDIDSWVCEVILKYNDFEIYRTLGVGCDKDEAILRAHLQLYMMFCHKLRFLDNLIISKKYIQQNSLTKGYNLHKNEKILSYEDIMGLPIISNFFNRLFGDNELYTKQIMNVLVDDFYIGEPFQNDSETIYCDPRILSRVIGATGVGVGETLNEAIENGIYSFLLEDTKIQLAKNPLEKYDILSHSLISSEKNLQYLTKANNEGYKVKIIDFSSFNNNPIIGLVLLNPNNLNYQFALGCNVDFEKALSQAFESLFLSSNSLKEDNRFITPYRELTTFDLLFTPDICNEINLLNKDEKDFLNTEIFNLSYLEKIKPNFSIKNIEGPIFTVQAVNFNSHFCFGYFADDDICSFMGNLAKKDNIIYLMRLKKQAEMIFSENEIFNLSNELYNRQEILTNDTGYTWYDGSFIGHFERLDWLNPMPSANILTSELTNLHYYDLDKIGLFSETPVQGAVKYFMSLQNMFMTGHYNKEEVGLLFKECFDIEVLEEHIEGLNNPQYLFNEFFVKPMHEYYNSEDYKNFISAFIL